MIQESDIETNTSYDEIGNSESYVKIETESLKEADKLKQQIYDALKIEANRQKRIKELQTAIDNTHALHDTAYCICHAHITIRELQNLEAAQ